MVYVDEGRGDRPRLDDGFVVSRTEVRRDARSGKITDVTEMEIARGKIVELMTGCALGRVLLRDPGVEVRSGDVVRFTGRGP
jgi:hypothetical protein